MPYEFFMNNSIAHLIISISVGCMFTAAVVLFTVGLVYFFRDKAKREEYEQYLKNRPGKKI